MKLVGSRTENEFREQLLRSREALFDGEYQHLGKFLKTEVPELRTAHVLSHTPDQSEDYFLILVNTDILVRIELGREMSAVPLVERPDFDQYKNGLSQVNRIRLAVALDLAEKEIEKHNF